MTRKDRGRFCFQLHLVLGVMFQFEEPILGKHISINLIPALIIMWGLYMLISIKLRVSKSCIT